MPNTISEEMLAIQGNLKTIVDLWIVSFLTRLGLTGVADAAAILPNKIPYYIIKTEYTISTAANPFTDSK